MSIIITNLFESFLGDIRKHNETTSQLSTDCPACQDGVGKGNLEINYEKNVFRCWSCSEINNMHGSIPKLIKKYGNKKILTEYLNLRPYIETSGNKIIHVDLKLPEGFKPLCNCKPKEWKCEIAMSYLRDRGITDEIIKEFNIGYTTTGKFFNRIIIPSYDINGVLNYFIARSFMDKTKLKYLNPDAEKQSIIFNEEKINFDSTIHIVEGVFDHIVTPNSIPLLGKHISDKLKELLYTKARASIIVLLDADAQLDAVRLYKELNVGDLYNRIKICTPPDGHDTSLIYQKYGNKGIIDLLKKSRQLTEIEIY